MTLKIACANTSIRQYLTKEISKSNKNQKPITQKQHYSSSRERMLWVEIQVNNFWKNRCLSSSIVFMLNAKYKRQNRATKFYLSMSMFFELFDKRLLLPTCNEKRNNVHSLKSPEKIQQLRILETHLPKKASPTIITLNLWSSYYIKAREMVTYLTGSGEALAQIRKTKQLQPLTQLYSMLSWLHVRYPQPIHNH